MTGIYRIANHVLQIDSLYSETHDLCREYQSSEEPEIRISISEADLNVERDKYRQMILHEHLDEKGPSEPYLETLAAYRKIAEWMPGQNTVLFHGSAVSVDGNAYLFTARSGTGKSTHVRLWREMLGNAAIMINDDKPLIQITDSDATVYGTPWNGKHKLGNNISVPLKAICILERSKENHIRKITKTEAYPMLLQQVYRPANTEAMHKTIDLIDRLRTQFYQLGCNMEPEAAVMAYNAMKG